MKKILKCPCCDSVLLSQPTVGDNYRTFTCLENYLTKNGSRAVSMKCEYKRIENNGNVVYEHIKNAYKKRNESAKR